MSDRMNNAFAAMLTPPPSKGVQFSQGVVLSWDNETLHNTIEWRGITLTDVPIIEGINALVIRTGDVVGMLGWAPENAKGVGSWWILGKLSNPGEFVADLSVTAKLFEFVTETGAQLAFFGKEIDGDPTWFLNYGGDDENIALRIANGNELRAYYRDGSIAWIISGTVGSQIFRIFDQEGHELFGTNGATGGKGMSDPAIPYHVGPTTSAAISGTTYLPSTTSAAFVTIWRGFNPVYHPVVSYGVVITSTGTPEWRIRVNIDSVVTEVASGSGSFSGTFSIPNFVSTFTPGSTVQFDFDARNTGGGVTHIGVDRIYGRQT